MRFDVVRGLFGVCLVAALSACSSDGGDDDDGGETDRYARIVEWRCFEGADCWCAGLERGDDAGSSDPQVGRCSFTTCFVYHPTSGSSSWHCSCGPDEFMPSSAATNVEPVPACPPE